MNKTGIKDQLKGNISAVVEFLASIPEDQLNNNVSGKWSIAENAIHLVKSVSPINVALSLPKITFLIFGKSISSRSYEEIITAYTSQLSQGAKASRAYIPRSGKRAAQSSLTANFEESYQRLITKLEAWSEEDLDSYRLPHPILGKLTIRELLYFTIYHLEHHLQAMETLKDPSKS